MGCEDAGFGVATEGGATVVGSGSGTDGVKVAGLLVSSAHSPSYNIVIFALGLRHCATDSSHAFPYVLKSDPHTGLNTAMHIVEQLGVLVVPAGVSATGATNVEDPAPDSVGSAVEGVAGAMYDVRSLLDICV